MPTLTANVTSHDAENDLITIGYQWTRNGTDIAGATAGTLDLATAGNGDKGDLIRVRATASDGAADSAPVTSSAVTVANSAPVFATDLQDRSSAVGDSATIDADCDRRRRRHHHLQRHRPARRDLHQRGDGRDHRHDRDRYDRTARVTITVSDGDLTATDTFTWTVSPPANIPPVVDTVTITPAAPTTTQL